MILAYNITKFDVGLFSYWFWFDLDVFWHFHTLKPIHDLGTGFLLIRD